jgi:hypothetical protein
VGKVHFSVHFESSFFILQAEDGSADLEELFQLFIPLHITAPILALPNTQLAFDTDVHLFSTIHYQLLLRRQFK